MGLTVCQCRYTRGNFIFPKSQPYPHTSFKDEVIYLEESLPAHLCFRKATVMSSTLPSHSWHVFSASDDEYSHVEAQIQPMYTVEVCMTELDRVLARKFFRRANGGESCDAAGKEMTQITGIGNINPNALVCDFGFDPCGYSMNGVDGDRYSTIHVTPEEGFSYASFECVGSVYDDPRDVVETLRKAVQVFLPGTLSVSTTCSSHHHQVWAKVGAVLEPLGLKWRGCAADEFPGIGRVVFQTFSSRRK